AGGLTSLRAEVVVGVLGNDELPARVVTHARPMRPRRQVDEIARVREQPVRVGDDVGLAPVVPLADERGHGAGLARAGLAMPQDEAAALARASQGHYLAQSR